MKILFLSRADGPDYQCDLAFLGLRQLLGPDCIDYPRLDHLYSDYGDTSALYGRGFTTTRILPADLPVDRDNLFIRALSGEFSLIVYGSIQRERMWWGKLTARLPRHRILAIDGEDSPAFLGGLVPFCIYLKRELALPHPGLHPISFAIPTSKIGTIRPLLKRKFLAQCDPRDRSTYTFTDESSYYRDYSESLFAITTRKAGWDALRHYEILANGCLPAFLDLRDCPATCCTALPKAELLEALDLYHAHPAAEWWDSPDGHAQWLSLWRRTHQRFVRHATTQALGQYILDLAAREAASA
jgi:hypothetical protein